MRSPALSKTPRRTRISGTVSIPAPIGGWNARDAYAQMDARDAVILQNWFPATTDCVLRSGFTQYATGLSGQVETLMEYAAGGSRKFFAITSTGNIYDVTFGGAVGAAVVTGLSNGRWQYTNVATTGGQFLYLVNGTDKPLLYDGATWTSIDGVSVPAITVVTTTSLVHVVVHKFRVWFIEKNTLKAWYLPTGAVGGAAAVLDLSSVAREGGALQAAMTWTIDAGYGVDDLLVFITTNGECIVYRGTDPSAAATWALVGVWALGSPVGRRCMFKYAGDCLIVTQDGLLPLAQALQSSRVNPRVALTDKIQYATSTAISSYGSNFGWQVCYFPKENMLLLNVPISEGSAQQQYVMNSISRSWCNFTGMAANVWELYNDNLYFGGNGFVGRAWNGLSDNAQNINGDGLQAFNALRSPAQLKRFIDMRPIFLTDGAPSLAAGVNIDFDVSDQTNVISITPTTAATWDSAVWDTSVWAGGLTPTKNWQAIQGVGYWAGARVKAQTNSYKVRWESTDFNYEAGGVV